MKQEYIHENRIIDLSEEEKHENLLLNIKKTQKSLRQDYINFELADSGLVDYYTYKIKANQAKLDFLIKCAKIYEKNI